MLRVSLPIVPFYEPPRKNWTNGQEKKERVEFEDSSDDESSAPPVNKVFDESSSMTSFDLSSAGLISENFVTKVEEKEAAEGVYIDDEDEDVEFNSKYIAHKKAIQKLISVDPLLAELYDEPPSDKIRFLDGPVRFFKLHFHRWKERMRKERMHYIIKEYYIKALKHNADIKIKNEEELRQKEAELMVEAYRSKKRIKASLFQASRKYKAATWITDAIAARDRDTKRMEFNCYNFQMWANENHERHIREEEERVLKEQHDAEIAKQIKKQERFNELRRLDAEVLAEDVELSQAVLQSMRQAGILPGNSLLLFCCV